MLYALYYPRGVEMTVGSGAGEEKRVGETKHAGEAKHAEEVKRAGEENCAEEIKDICCDTFQYTIERMRHYHDEWHSVTATLFPNFLFLDCGEEAAEKLREERLPLVRIPEELSELLNDLSDEQHFIRMSKGIIKGGIAHVTEGPLIGHDNRIVRIDRHKKLAWLKTSSDAPASAIDFAKESTSVLVAGLEITERLP
ncbi:MAG: hypothetical protein LIP10_12085 [Clostridiales bacterium]|nr:hypothetical protein [Clostridiales bacterium]